MVIPWERILQRPEERSERPTSESAVSSQWCLQVSPAVQSLYILTFLQMAGAKATLISQRFRNSRAGSKHDKHYRHDKSRLPRATLRNDKPQFPPLGRGPELGAIIRRLSTAVLAHNAILPHLPLSPGPHSPVPEPGEPVCLAGTFEHWSGNSFVACSCAAARGMEKSQCSCGRIVFRPLDGMISACRCRNSGQVGIERLGWLRSGS